MVVASAALKILAGTVIPAVVVINLLSSSSYLGSIIGRYLSQVLISGLSRKDEFEADAYASALLIKSDIGIAPQVSLLKKLEKLTGIVSPNITWTLSHPSPDQRIKAIQALEASWMTSIKDQN